MLERTERPRTIRSAHRVADFSSRNSTVDISAPGDQIASTTYTPTPAAPIVKLGSGTSQAAPMVSGSAAVLFAVRPDAQPAQVESALLNSARPIGGARTDEYGRGRLDPVAALEALNSSAIPLPSTNDTFRNARIPSLCGFSPGVLVGGVLPGIAPGDGMVGLDERFAPAVGDVNADQITDAAVVMSCTHGGVAWPDQLVLYTAGNVVVGSIDLGVLSGDAPRATVESLAFQDGRFEIAWLTNQAGDLDCCPTRHVTASVTIANAAPMATAPVDVSAAGPETSVTLTSCEGVDLTPVTEIGAFAGLTESTCAAPWALVAFSEADPSVSVALVRYSDDGQSDVVDWWGDLELGDNPDYTPEAIAAHGLSIELARAMYEELGGPSGGNLGSSAPSCTTLAVAADTDIDTEAVQCAEDWAVGVPAACGDNCEHVEVFQLQGQKWISRGGYFSSCPDALVDSGIPLRIARQLVPSVLCPTTGTVSSQRLQRDDVGEDVRSLQQALRTAGYELDVDGEFGPGTEQAVEAYQRDLGLEVDGIAGPATLRSLGLIP